MIICLAGSTRFKEKFDEVSKRLEAEGHVVLKPSVYSGYDPKDADMVQLGGDDIRNNLIASYYQKIKMCDKMIVINMDGGYIGDDTKGDILYAIMQRKKIEFINDLTLSDENDWKFAYSKLISFLERNPDL